MNRESLESLVAEALSPDGAEQYISHIRDHAELSPALERNTNSWVGGHPAKVTLGAWPEWSGRPLSFVANIDLADVAPVQTNLGLPLTGRLSFFVDADDPPWGLHLSDRGAWLVAYTPQDEGVVLQPPNRATVFERVDLGLTTGVSSPCLYEPAVGTILRDERDGLAELNWVWDDREQRVPRHQLGGWPRLAQEDIWTDSHYGIESVAWADRPRGGKLGDPGPPGSEDWLLLLQLDTDEHAGWMWADGGMLYFSVRKQDLAAMRFDQVWMSLQC